MSGPKIAFVAEKLQDELAPMTFELLAAAKSAAGPSGGGVSAYAIGHGLEPLLPSLSAAGRVLAADAPVLAGFAPEPYLKVLEAMIRQDSPDIVLLGGTSMGHDLAATLAARLGRPCVLGCRSIQPDGNGVTCECQFYAGKMNARVRVDGFPCVLSMAPGAHRELRETGNAEIVHVPLPDGLGEGAVRFEEMILPEAGDVDITRRDVLVAAGRGVQQEDNLEIVEELAEALGGAVCASRPVVDQGWLPVTRQVGKSGMTVKPKFYLALGVSGAPEHVEGMRDSSLIVAVNTDPKAPIFETAHYGAVADLLDLVPALTEKLRHMAHS